VRLRVPGPLRHVNGWILDDGDGVAVVDTGMDRPETRAAWERVLAGRRVSRVICTHMHPDHFGLAGPLCARDGAPLLMTRGEWLTGRLLRADARDAVPDAVVAWWVAAGWSADEVATAQARGWAGFAKITADPPMGYTRIADDERLRIGAAEWRVVVGSGHSPEHACLLDEAGGVLIAGDQVLPRISPNVSLGVLEPEADPLGAWLASIDRLRQLPADLLVLPGHGDPFTNLHARLDAMAAEHHDRLDALAERLREPATARDCFGTLFRRPVGPDMLGMATGEALAHLRRLERDGRVRAEWRDGVSWWRAV
jgi:glyoxylase-like metal-dependent hydrolase (beta-lactamase superfamily II)